MKIKTKNDEEVYVSIEDNSNVNLADIVEVKLNQKSINNLNEETNIDKIKLKLHTFLDKIKKRKLEYHLNT